MNLNTPQLVGLLVSVLGIAALAVITGAKQGSTKKSNGSAITAGIIMGTLVGGSSTVGTAQLAYNFGMSAWWFTLGGGLACLVLALGFVGPWRHSGSPTLIGIVAKEFGPRAGMAASLLSGVGTFINVISQLIAGTAVIAVAAPALGLVPALIITAAFMALYVLAGGTRGAGMVGVLKLALLYVSMIGCGIVVLILTGGLDGFLEMVGSIDNPEGIRFGSLFARGVSKDAGAGLSLILGVLTTQTYAQGVLSGKSDQSARRGALASAILIPPIGIGGILVGLFMRANHPGIVAKTALTAFATEYLPPALSGILLGTLFIAVVGTGAGLSMGISTIIRKDILQRFNDKMADPKASENANRVIILLILGAGILLSTGSLGDTILSFAFMSMGLRGAVIFVPMVCALWMSGKVNRNFALAGIIAGPLVVLLCGTVLKLPGGIDPLFAGVAAALVCCIAGRIVGTRVRTVRTAPGWVSNGSVSAIAVDGELNAGAEALAGALADRLQIPCYSSEISEDAAAQSGIPLEKFKRVGGYAPAADSAADTGASAGTSDCGTMISAQMEACRKLAASGSCILLDGAAGSALNGENSVSIFVHKDFEQRAAAFAENNGIGPAAARRQLRKLDNARKGYYRTGNGGWGTPKSYQIYVDATGTESEQLCDELLPYLRPAQTGTTGAEKR